MRPALAKVFSTEDVPFPNVERRTIIFNSPTTVCMKVYCYCCCIDTGEKMVCDSVVNAFTLNVY